ncbi:MAG: protein translocase subunit SecDF [Bacteroidales bacterium]|nr:protein translocase subunit SecDF [Bacteroidales bacterium]
MRNKGFILFFAVTFALVCIYSLSFTYCTRRVENKAKEYAQNDPTRDSLIARANGNAFMETYLLDSSAKARENRYLQRVSDSTAYNLLFAKWTYKECKELEINLGLDLKGGMNVTLEVSVPNIVTSLAGNGAKDSLFVKTMKLAREKQYRSQSDFITLFEQSFKEVAPANAKLSTIFRKLQFNKNNPTNAEVISALREETESALNNAYMVLRARIDRFGVTQPNIQRLPQSGRIMVELPGVKEPDRVRKLLQGSANLEFWKTYEFGEIADLFAQANDRIAEINSGKKETVKDTAVTDEADEAAKEGQAENFYEGADSTDTEADEEDESQMTPEQIQAKYPLLSKLVMDPQRRPDEDGKYGPLIGYCHESDTADINAMLNMDVVKSLFPQDLKICWQAKLGKDKTPVHYLIALKAVGEQGPVLDGKVVVDARQDFNDRAGNEISMTMNTEGAKQWKKITEENKGNCIAIVLDNLVYSYPRVNDVIPNGRSSITGGFSLEEAKDLANLLKAGKLPAPAVIVSEEIVGPTLGKESIHSSLISFIIAFCLVLIYMAFYYSRAGWVAGIALVTNILFIFGTLASIGAVLTLPGIAGIVLTLGMAVDANVIIFERIREEIRAGKGVRLALADGYKAAYSAIIDGNVTTLITGIILFIFGSGPIQGFATTLIIGILSSLFTAIFVTRLIFNWMFDKNKEVAYGNKWTLNAMTNFHFDFLAKRKVFYVVSAVLIGIGIISLCIRGLNFGIDFTGGRTYTVRFDQPVKADDLRASLTKVYDGITPEVKTFGSDNQMKITSKWRFSNGEDESSEIDSLSEVRLYEGLKGFFKSNVTFEDFSVQNQSVGLISSQKVGATVSRDITRSAFISVLIALLCIFVYIALRFRNWQFGLGGIICLAHDALFIIGTFSLLYGLMPFTMEVDQAFIAAILTIIGYSINDTVVVFDRVREYRTLYPKRNLKDNINAAVNSTLSRTINTSGTTLVTLLAIFLLGGEVIRGFVFALLLGILIGTYSSIFISTPVSYEFLKKKEDSEEIEKK